MFETVNDFQDSLNGLTKRNEVFFKAAFERQKQLTKPPGSLGKLEEYACFMAAWQGNERPEIKLAQALVFAGNHGVCDQGVNPFPQEVTMAMVENFRNGGAAINQLAAYSGADLDIILLSDGQATADITVGPAMSEQECLEAINRGAEAVNSKSDILLLGEMGIGNSTISSALCLGTFGGQGLDWVGAGTGSNTEGIFKKAKVIERARIRNQESLNTPFEILMSLGGREQAAICGALVAARCHSIPVIIDGFIASSAIAPLVSVDQIYDNVIFAHQSAEAGHSRLLSKLGKVPMFDLGMRLGEGSGAALALSIVRASLACHNGMATFAEAGIGE